MTKPNRRCFSVMFKDFKIWSVNSYFELGWKWPKEFIKPLSYALKRKQSKVDRTKFTLDSLKFVSLHFDGSMELKNVGDFKGQLFFADSGDVIYSKIDLRNGAIGIVPNEIKQIAVSNEFPVYYVSKDKALPDYIKLVFRTDFFRRAINSMISGTSGRKRVKPNEIEDVEIPLPPLLIQKDIVERWNYLLNQIFVMKKRLEKIEKETHNEIINLLGIQLPKSNVKKRVFATNWNETERWGVDWNRQRLYSTDFSKSLFPVTGVEELTEFMQYGTNDKAQNREGIPVLRINNVKSGQIDFSELKYIKKPIEAIEHLLLKDGDILIIRTNGSKDLVGTCAVFHGEGNFIFASYLIRIRINQKVALPDYVAFFLNSQLGRSQINAVSRQIMQNNINSTEIKGLRIPLPTIEVQNDIAKKLDKARENIEEVKNKINEMKTKIGEQIERAILFGVDEGVEKNNI